MHPVLSSSLTVLAAVVDPGQGIAPPGADKITTVVSYVAWLATAACVVGFLVAGTMMALSNSGHGSGGQHGSRLGWVMGGCVVIGMASGLVGALA